jgi:SPOR domain
VQSDLDPLGVGKLTTQRRVEVSGVWSATLAPYPNRAAADRRAGELRAQNLRDVAVVDAGSGRYTVAIGAFRTEEAANAHASELARLGIAVPVATQRTQPLTQTLFVVRDPPANVVSRLRELQATYPGAELKVGNCERA